LINFRTIDEQMSEAGSPARSPAEPTQELHEEGADEVHQDGGAADAMSDNESDMLSEVDEDQFGDDYDPTNEQPITIDDNIAATLKAAKRKRTDGETTKKPKEGRRPKKRTRGADDADEGDDDGGARRPRKARTDGERRTARKEAPQQKEAENEEHLTPDERRRRAIDRAIDAELKNPVKRRRKKDEIVSTASTFRIAWWCVLLTKVSAVGSRRGNRRSDRQPQGGHGKGLCG